MKLTNILLKHHRMFIGPMPKFRGSAMKGKHKYVPSLTKGERYMLWYDWRNEEEVLKNISVPYITADEELDYLESIGEKYQNVDPLYTSQIVEPMRQHYAVDLLRMFERNRQFEIWE